MISVPPSPPHYHRASSYSRRGCVASSYLAVLSTQGSTTGIGSPARTGTLRHPAGNTWEEPGEGPRATSSSSIILYCCWITSLRVSGLLSLLPWSSVSLPPLLSRPTFSPDRGRRSRLSLSRLAASSLPLLHSGQRHIFHLNPYCYLHSFQAEEEGEES